MGTYTFLFCLPVNSDRVFMQSRDVWTSQARLFCSHSTQGALPCRGPSAWGETGYRSWLGNSTTTCAQNWGKKSQWKHHNPPWRQSSNHKMHLLWQHIIFAFSVFPKGGNVCCCIMLMVTEENAAIAEVSYTATALPLWRHWSRRASLEHQQCFMACADTTKTAPIFWKL